MAVFKNFTIESGLVLKNIGCNAFNIEISFKVATYLALVLYLFVTIQLIKPSTAQIEAIW